MKKINGFTLIEILLALAITMAIAISSFFIYNKVKDEQNINKVISEVNQIREASKTFYNIQNSYSGLNEKILISLDLIPKEIVNKNSELINSYGGNITVGPSASNNALRFNIIYNNVPASDCVKIASIISSSLFLVGISNSVGAIKNEDKKLSILGASNLCNLEKSTHVNMLFQSS